MQCFLKDYLTVQSAPVYPRQRLASRSTKQEVNVNRDNACLGQMQPASEPDGIVQIRIRIVHGRTNLATKTALRDHSEAGPMSARVQSSGDGHSLYESESTTSDLNLLSRPRGTADIAGPVRT